MNKLLWALAALLPAARPAAAQTGNPLIDSPAAYREAGLRGPEHVRLVHELLRYELRNIRALVAPRVLLRPEGYSLVLTNRATVAETTGGSYTVTYHDGQGQVLGTHGGRFGGMAPGASRNEAVTAPPPPGTARADVTITDLQAE